jgi:hypothetical protein
LRLLLVAGPTHGDAAQAVAADLAHGAEREVESPAASEGAAVQHRQRIFLPFSSLVTTEMVPNASVRCAQETPLAFEALGAVAGWARTGGSGRKFRIDFGAGAAEVRRYCAKLEARMTLRLLRRCCPVLRAAWLGQSITSCERRMGCDCK